MPNLEETLDEETLDEETLDEETLDATGEHLGGIPAGQLNDEDLRRELGNVHRTRHATLRHGSDQALEHHNQRTSELEDEYLRRFPAREVDPQRLRQGARARAERRPPLRTGADQPWDPEDLAVAEGRDPTPANIERARRKLAELGPAAIERTVP